MLGPDAMHHGTSDPSLTGQLCRETGSLQCTATRAHQMAWARYMAPMMVNEAMPDSTRILMTVSGSGPGEVRQALSRINKHPPCQSQSDLQKKAIDICFLVLSRTAGG